MKVLVSTALASATLLFMSNLAGKLTAHDGQRANLLTRPSCQDLNESLLSRWKAIKLSLSISFSKGRVASSSLGWYWELRGLCSNIAIVVDFTSWKSSLQDHKGGADGKIHTVGMNLRCTMRTCSMRSGTRKQSCCISLTKKVGPPCYWTPCSAKACTQDLRQWEPTDSHRTWRGERFILLHGRACINTNILIKVALKADRITKSRWTGKRSSAAAFSKKPFKWTERNSEGVVDLYSHEPAISEP